MGTGSAEDVRNDLAQRVISGDRAGAVCAALSAVADGSLDVQELHAVLSNVLRDIGRAWRQGTTAVWQEHRATAIVRTIVESLAPKVLTLAAPPNGRTVVLACPEDESHELGLRMLADRFILSGWTVVYLGADTPAGEIASAARSTAAALIVLSASTHFHRVRLRSVLETLSVEVGDVRVLVGGPALCDGEGEIEGHVFDPNEFFGDAAGLAPSCEES